MVKNFPSRLKNYLRRKFRKLKFGNQAFLIYSMGKVGTTTVYSLLKKQYPAIPAFHVHFLSDFWVKEKLPSLDKEFHSNITLAEKIHASLKQLPGHKIKVVTMVREPMVREISDIFENWKGLLHVNSIGELTIDQLKKYLDANDHEFVLNWFDTEFKAYLGFDIYSVPFNKEKGYSIYKTPKADILCIRTDKMNDCLVNAMKEFSGLDLVLSGSANTSENKEGKELYKELSKNYKAPKEKLAALYGSKLVTHFYSEKEIDELVKKWSREEWNFKTLFRNG
jgi:hypothetical protein